MRAAQAALVLGCDQRGHALLGQPLPQRLTRLVVARGPGARRRDGVRLGHQLGQGLRETGLLGGQSEVHQAPLPSLGAVRESARRRRCAAPRWCRRRSGPKREQVAVGPRPAQLRGRAEQVERGLVHRDVELGPEDLVHRAGVPDLATVDQPRDGAPGVEPVGLRAQPRVDHAVAELGRGALLTPQGDQPVRGRAEAPGGAQREAALVAGRAHRHRTSPARARRGRRRPGRTRRRRTARRSRARRRAARSAAR